MKKLLLFLCLACCVAFAQVNTVNGKVTYTSTVPSGSCSQNNQAEFIVPTGVLWSCQNGTWTQIGGSGTGVSSVSGTANQVDVATGTTTPVISLDPAIILPGSLTVPTGSSIVFPLGSVSSPAFQATGSAANTGFYWSSTTAPCTLSAGAVVDCFPSGGIIIGNAKNYEFSQTASGTGAAGPSIGVVGSSTTEWLNTSTPIILPQCKIAAPVTLSTTTTICTWTLPNSAQTFSYQCQGTYSTSAASITLLLGTQFAQAPSAGANNAIIWSAASAQTFGTATNTGTTAVPTMTGAAVSSGTNIPWQASGTFTSSATSGTFVIYGTASTATDVTIATGSSCNLF